MCRWSILCYNNGKREEGDNMTFRKGVFEAANLDQFLRDESPRLLAYCNQISPVPFVTVLYECISEEVMQRVYRCRFYRYGEGIFRDAVLTLNIAFYPFEADIEVIASYGQGAEPKHFSRDGGIASIESSVYFDFMSGKSL